MSALPKTEDDRRTRAELQDALGELQTELALARAARDEALTEVKAATVAVAAAKDEIATLQDDLRDAAETHAGEIAVLEARFRRADRTARGLAAQIGALAAREAVSLDSAHRRVAINGERARQRFTVTAAGADQAAADAARADILEDLA